MAHRGEGYSGSASRRRLCWLADRTAWISGRGLLAALLGTTAVLSACGEAFTSGSGQGGQSATTSGTTTDTSTTTTTQTVTTSTGGAGQGGSQGGGGVSGGGLPTGGAGGGLAVCGTECTSQGFTCCPSGCVNTGNDINNCGQCSNPCGGVHPYCDDGECGTPPTCVNNVCEPPSFCCGATCCENNQLCCVVPSSVQGPPTCVDLADTGTCPLGCLQCACAAPDTPVATGDGDRAIAAIGVGDYVWSLDRGLPLLVPVVALNRTAVHDHVVVRVTFADDTTFEMSARHPTADGRPMGELAAGDFINSRKIIDIERVSYPFDQTYDILPASDSGSYLVAGAWIGSTLAATGPNACAWGDDVAGHR